MSWTVALLDIWDTKNLQTETFLTNKKACMILFLVYRLVRTQVGTEFLAGNVPKINSKNSLSVHRLSMGVESP